MTNKITFFYQVNYCYGSACNNDWQSKVENIGLFYFVQCIVMVSRTIFLYLVSCFGYSSFPFNVSSFDLGLMFVSCLCSFVWLSFRFNFFLIICYVNEFDLNIFMFAFHIDFAWYFAILMTWIECYVSFSFFYQYF